MVLGGVYVGAARRRCLTVGLEASSGQLMLGLISQTEQSLFALASSTVVYGRHILTSLLQYGSPCISRFAKRHPISMCPSPPSVAGLLLEGSLHTVSTNGCT